MSAVKTFFRGLVSWYWTTAAVIAGPCVFGWVFTGPLTLMEQIVFAFLGVVVSLIGFTLVFFNGEAFEMWTARTAMSASLDEHLGGQE